jgi:catechol 2,3-dioxygenase-like lactoylglutathione lyase family enzyme
MPRITSILETCLHVGNVEHSAQFYERVFGFLRVDSDARFCALEVASRSMLLRFLRNGTQEAVSTPGGVIPPHGGGGDLHLAFAIPAEDLGAWEGRLVRYGIAIESRVKWPRGGTSLYFRDPDNHLVELATPGIWPSY